MGPAATRSSLTKRLAFWLTLLANVIVPKDTSLWVFRSLPPYVGNAKALYEYLRERAPAVRCVWFVRDRRSAQILQARAIQAVVEGSVEALWLFLRADTFVVTHGGFDTPRVRRQRVVNLWHGMPLKSIEEFLPSRVRWESPLKGRLRRGPRDVMIATSGLTRALLAAAFGLPPRQVRVINQPRTDRLIRRNPRVREWMVSTSGAAPDERFVVMLPTYRQGGSVLDGQKINRVLEEGQGWDAIQAALEGSRSHLFLKLHPSEPEGLTRPPAHSRIHVVTDTELLQADVDLYDLLAWSDLLVTDYSSVFIDYLMLDRPIVFYVPDLNDYHAIRNFLLEPYEFWTPGPKATTMADLARELQKSLSGVDIYKEHRQRLVRILHRYVDDRGTARLAEFLGVR